jgi:hypothetical protein
MVELDIRPECIAKMQDELMRINYCQEKRKFGVAPDQD